jgi:dynein heavy chain
MQAGLLGKLEELQVKQEQCKKALGEFLDGKRRQFARFYFMSETDLLDLLSNSSQPIKVLQHVDKILLATKHIEIDTDRTVVDDGRLYAFHFQSQVGHEKVRFNPMCRVGGKAEMYLQALLEAQQRTLSKCLKGCAARASSLPRTEWLLKRENGDSVDPAQIILLVALIDFTSKVEQSLGNILKGESNSMKEFLRLVSTQLADLIRLTQTSLTSGDRQRLMCLITLDAHNRDIVESLILEKVTNASDFQWQSKLRPTILAPRDSKSDECGATFYICNASFDYGFEYLGNGPRLVVTPLTDRIYVTATQALHLKMGCAPAGPAGTGKTESTKELASALGKCCYVFNCSPEMDYQSMGNIFKGLAASGSWGCFDEFNRLIPEVLSVCSVQFKAVCDALKAYDPQIESTHQVTIEGDTVALDPTCGAFITMNPGYLGRSELPEGLKALFRPITVVVPDLVLICENMLMAEGFLTAKVLASKFYGLYSLLSELLSKQPHYDWGLRAVKSVLVVAGMLKRAEPDLAEDALLMRALRDFNIPKIVQADEVIFFGLLNDLFPGLSPLRVIDEKLESCIVTACEASRLLPDPFFCLKVMQMEELLAIRHCVFIMGPSGAGKSTCWKLLQAARNLKTPNNKVKVADLNPKVMPTENLYGHINMVTREWKDGLLSAVLRDLGRIPNEHPKWLVLDGDLDANWIESMNSVMDDNKMLTLASNERIPLKHYMRMIFEIRDLKYATPATVSRAGILFISTDEGTQWRSIARNWVRTRPKELLDDLERDRLQALFDRFLPECVRYSRVSLRHVVNCNDISLVTSLLRLLDSMIIRAVLAEETSLESAFVFCLIWAFGSVLTVSDDGTDNKKLFSEWFRGKFKLKTIPSRDSIFDYWLDNKSYKFEPWKSSPAFKTVEFDSSRMSMAQVTIPTPETASISFWLELLVHRGNHAMLAGPAGTGKTQLINGLLSGLNKDQYMNLTVNMNYYTSASVLLTSLELPLQKRTGSVFGPPGSFKLVYFVDDLNLPEVDPYGTQSSIALLRQHIDYGHWYDMSKLSMKIVDDCMYIAALNPTAGSFHVNPRLQRHFTTFAIGMPSSASLLLIFQTFLEGHLVGAGFSQEICSSASNIVKAALHVHKDISETFRKTAANFHYEFNIRHLANVFQGLLVANTQSIRDAEKLVLLWLHESERAYGDRLVSSEDLLKFKEIIQNQARKTFIQYNVSRFAPSSGNTKSELLLFCHFADGTNQGSELTYDRATNIDDVRGTLEAALDEYNETHSTMNLVLFDDAVLHIARIVRIIKQSGGHALLVGVGGSGKQSLSRIAGHVCGYSTVQISVSQQYNMNDFKTDLQNMYSKAGVKQEGVLFILSDAQINNERFFVYLNDLLSSGNIPDLYSRDEKEGIVNALAGRAKSAGYSTDPASVWSYFISRIRTNLHCCLCFSPVGPLLRTRAKRFPALANCTVIDWFQPWPEQALLSVGKRLLSNIDLGSDEVHAAVVKYAPAAFLGVSEACQLFASKESRMVYLTPKSYLEAIHLFQSLLAKKREETDASIHRLATGVEKLIRAAADVVELESKLKVMLATAEEKRRVTEEIAKNLKLEKDVVEAENEKAQIESANVSRIQIEVAAKQADAQNDLAQAEPALIRAMTALDSLDRRDLGNCKTMAKPPPGVEDVFGAVMVLLAGINPNIIVQKTGKVREKERTWDASKKALLGNVNGFLDELKAFKMNIDDGSVPETNWKEVRPFLALEHFTPEIIEKRNSAAAGLCAWVINIVNYFDIVQLVEPKRIALRGANEELRVANEQLDSVRAKVAELQAKLDILTADFNAAEDSMKDAQNTANKGKMKLELANRLTNALGSERQRWLDGIEGFKAEREVLVGDCLLASAFISYVGPFTKPFRDYLMNTYMNPLLSSCGAPIPCTKGADALALVCSDADVAAYQTQGLPADQVSSENAAIVLNSVRYPLLVDPQLQAIFWLKRRAKLTGENLRVGRLGQTNLIKEILSAIENGEGFLVENIGEQIDASMMSVLRRTAVKRGGKSFVILGDSEVEFNPNFRLYLHTKLSNPHYPPEIQAETTLVNFSVTPGGLEEQILALVVKNERPDLAAQRAALILQQNLFLIKVKQLEDNILVRLSSAQGDITEDRALIEELEMSKKISDEIAHKLTESQKTSEKIDMTSELYRPVAKRGSLLFFILNNLNRIHTYYMFSLNSFLYFFLRGITGAGKSDTSDFGGRSDVMNEDSNSASVDLDALAVEIEKRVQEIEERDKLAVSENLPERINLLKKSASSVIFDFVRTGLFEQDKLTVASQICLRILVEEGALDKALVDGICRCRAADDVPPRGDDLSKWLSELSWSRLKAVEEDFSAAYPQFCDILEKITAECEDWEEWYNQPNPEVVQMPGEWKELSQFQRILLLRILRPDRFPTAMSHFICEHLGPEFVTQPTFDLEKTYKYATAATPILFVLYPGVDPTTWVEDLGRKYGMTSESRLFANISMGQGQEARADNMIRELAKVGGWVFLQNVHLMQTWITTLEEKLETLSPHHKFRVFITAEPPPLPYMKNIPEGLLRSSIVVANEPPSDLRANLARAWGQFDEERLSQCIKSTEFRACLFGLCFFHSLILGRRRFGFQGWSRSYGFNNGDLRICSDVLESNLNKDIPNVPWKDLIYMFGEIMYGGHITDFFDRRINNAYLEFIFKDTLLCEGELSHSFRSPNAKFLDYQGYMNLISSKLPEENPSMYGLHANAEIGFLSNKTEKLFQSIIALDLGSVAGVEAEGGTSPIALARETIDNLIRTLPLQFNLFELSEKLKTDVHECDMPYAVVVVQECTRLNSLLQEIRVSLEELVMGLNGQLNMSQSMEDMLECMTVNLVPGRNPFHACSWERLAWPSRKNLSSWFADMILRRMQLDAWSKTLQLPYSIWLPGLINPTALLTAIKQVRIFESHLLKAQDV